MLNNPRIWYWKVAGHTGVFSSASLSYVDDTADATYLAWAATGMIPTPIDSEQSLADVLASVAPDLAPQFKAGLNGYALRKQASLAAGGCVVNSAPPIATNALTAIGPGSRTLHFAAVPAWVAAGQPVSNITTPGSIAGGSTVVSKTGTTVVISADIQGAGVGSGDEIQFSLPETCKTDTDSKVDLVGLVVLSQLDGTFTTPWPPDAIATTTLTADRIIAMGQNVGRFVQATKATLATVLGAIDAVTITTGAQIDSAGWPDRGF
jgi:hypothetical protein